MAIDPGKKGGVVIVSYDGGFVTSAPLPYSDGFVNVSKLKALVSSYRPTLAFVELQQIRSGQSGAMAIGANYGAILATLRLEGLYVEEVAPQRWQEETIGTGHKDTKKASIAFCLDHDLPLPRRSGRKDSPYHDGIADAYCLAVYGVGRIAGRIEGPEAGPLLGSMEDNVFDRIKGRQSAVFKDETEDPVPDRKAGIAKALKTWQAKNDPLRQF